MAEAPRSLPSGYDEEFASGVEDDFHCLICQLPLKEPVLTRCGHRFCKECLDEHLRRQRTHAQPSTCPADRAVLDQDRDVFPDKATERRILSLAIKCPSDGCNWTGELRDKEMHLATCPFEVVRCIYANCSVRVKRKDLEEHVTFTCERMSIKCEYCRTSHPKCKMQDHNGKCSKFPVPCPNNCSDVIPREMVERGNVESHLQAAMVRHLDLACAKFNSTQVQLSKTQVELKSSQEKIRKLEEKLNRVKFVWKINGFSAIMNKAKTGDITCIDSAPFYTESYGYKLKVRVYPDGHDSVKGTHLSVFIISMKGEYDAILPWPMERVVKFTLIDQQEDANPVTWENVLMHFWRQFLCTTPRPLEKEPATGKIIFMSHQELQTRRYLADDTLFLQVEVFPP